MTHKAFRFAVATLALTVWASASAVSAMEGEIKANIPLSDAKIIVELNATAEDVGVQVFLDGEAWKSMKIFNPRGRKLFDVFTKGSVGTLGVTELFFESQEPSLADLPLDEFLELFPEGNYTFVGETIEGDKITGHATFTHAIPEGPVVIAPLDGAGVNPANTVIRWEPVDDPVGSEISGYQVIVEREDPHRQFQATVSAARTSLTVPAEFLDAATDYKFEILAIEAGGNQTITEGEFRTQ